MTIRRDYQEPADLGLSADQLAFIVSKARAFDVQVAPSDPDEGSNGADDRMIDTLEDTPDNPVGRELRGAIAALGEDGQAALVALTWIGRGDFEPEEWDDALQTARERKDGPTARYLLGIPLLGDFIEEGADKFGVSLTHEEQIGMHHPVTERPAEEDRD